MAPHRPGLCSLAPLAVLSLLAACGDKGTEASGSPAAAPAEPAAPVKADVAAKADVKPEPAVKAEPEGPTEPSDEWLVWFSHDGRLVTRWIDVARPGDGVVAERKALVVSDGTSLLRVHRDDGEANVVDVECADAGKDDCRVTAKLTIPGISATDLVSLATYGPYRAQPKGAEIGGGPVVGGGISLSMRMVGGVGAQLWVRQSDVGYYGGVHDEVSESTVVFDAVTGRSSAMAEQLEPKQGTLPPALRREAAEELLGALKDCDDEVPLAELLDERMALAGLRLALVDGKPRLAWEYVAETYYACSPDYLVHAEVTSEPLSVDSLGVAALPPGVRRAMTHLGSAPVLGWADLELQGDARGAALAAFERAPEDPWPSGETTVRPVEGTGRDHADAMKLVSQGRRLTREEDYDGAIVAFDDAIALEEDLPSAWSGRGYAKLLAGKLDAAEPDLERALKLAEGPKIQAMVLYDLGLLAEKRGNRAAAVEAYRESLGLRDNETVRSVLEKLEAK